MGQIMKKPSLRPRTLPKYHTNESASLLCTAQQTVCATLGKSGAVAAKQMPRCKLAKIVHVASGHNQVFARHGSYIPFDDLIYTLMKVLKKCRIIYKHAYTFSIIFCTILSIAVWSTFCSHYSVYRLIYSLYTLPQRS